MAQRFVIGIDSSTQSTKAIVWNEKGQPISEGRAQISMKMPEPGHAEQNPHEWWDSFKIALGQAIKKIDPMRVEGISISNQRETVAFLDHDGTSLHDAMVWLDERAANEVESLCKIVGEEQIHKISGNDSA